MLTTILATRLARGFFTRRPRPSVVLRGDAAAHISRENKDVSARATPARYLFVHSSQLRVLVEQQELLLVARGDGHALRDQGHLLLRGQQPVPRGTGIAGPARRWEKGGTRFV